MNIFSNSPSLIREIVSTNIDIKKFTGLLRLVLVLVLCAPGRPPTLLVNTAHDQTVGPVTPRQQRK